MANRRQLVKRRKSVGNIRKITRTMQLIATARFQKALNRAQATRPYASKLAAMLEAASASLERIEHPLLKVNEGNHSALIIVSANRGLCGGYNGNILRTALADTRRRRADGQTVDLHVVGKKGVNYLTFLGEAIASKITSIDDRPRFEQAAPIADRIMDAYKKQEVAEVNVCYMRFISAGSQQPHIMRLLPIKADQPESTEGPAKVAPQFDFLPGPKQILEELLPATVRMRLFECFADAAVSEQVARMVAMKAATDAAGDMIKLLTRQYNRARQTQITMELLDIIGGAAAIS